MGLLTNALRMQTDYIIGKEKNQATIDAAKENTRGGVIRGAGTEVVKAGMPLVAGYVAGRNTNDKDDGGNNRSGGKMTKAEGEKVFEKLTRKPEPARMPEIPPSVYGAADKPKQLTPFAQRIVDNVNEKPLGRWLVNDALKLPTSSNSNAWTATGALGASGALIRMVPVL